MKTPMDLLLDKADWRCTACGTSRSVGCDCWIRLVCKVCDRKRSIPRGPREAGGAVMISAGVIVAFLAGMLVGLAIGFYGLLWRLGP